MYELVTLILVVYVVGTILRRSTERKREMERLAARVNHLNQIVNNLRDGNANKITEQIIELELRELQDELKDFQDFNCSADSAAQEAFEHLHFVEETISKSIFLAPELPSQAESTLH